MNYMKVLRITGVTLILSLLLVAIPAAPALAINEISLSPSSGAVGDSITVIGDDWASTYRPGDHEYWAEIYFAKDSRNINQLIGGQSSSADTYNYLAESYDSIDSDGAFEATFTIPTRLTHGTDDEDVTTGTYYVYVTLSRDDTGDNNIIKAKETFTVTASGTLNTPSPTSGSAGTTVTLSGTGFLASYPIIFRFDSISLTPTGDQNTNTAGSFTSTVTIPQTTAGTHTIYVTVGSITKSHSFTVTANPVLNTPVPPSGPAGTDISLTGTGFPANSSITFTLDPGQIILSFKSGPTTDSAGTVNSVVTIPSSTIDGVYAITIRVGTTTQSKEFTVTGGTATTTTPTTTTTVPTTTTTTTTTQPPPSAVVNVNASGNNVGAVIGIIGAGFTPSTLVNVRFDDEVLTTATSNADGTILVTIEAPTAESGDHIITASDGTHTGTITFTIESVPPGIPQPLKPEMEVKVKTPIIFEWEEVEDVSPASNPVTYELQIATSASFGASSVVIDKKNLTAITYELSPAEELELEGRTAPYYWRIRAVDAASNASQWTGAGEFYASSPGSFPSWALYTIIGVGAVFVFLIGYWLGRRSAFYY